MPPRRPPARRPLGRPAHRLAARRPPVDQPPVFSADDPDSRGYVPEADRFPPGVTRAEATRILAVRAGVLAAMLADPRVLAVFTGWQDDAIAFNAAWRPGSRRQWPPLHVDRLLASLALPASWRPWLGVGLLHTFHRWLHRRLNEPGEAVILPGEVAVLAPPSAWLFLIEAGESTDAARARFRAMATDFETALAKAAPQPKRRAQRRAPVGAFLFDWGAWLYDARYRRPERSITQIARENHTRKRHPGTAENHDCRRPIQLGIEKARRILILAARG